MMIIFPRKVTSILFFSLGVTAIHNQIPKYKIEISPIKGNIGDMITIQEKEVPILLTGTPGEDKSHIWKGPLSLVSKSNFGISIPTIEIDTSLSLSYEVSLIWKGETGSNVEGIYIDTFIASDDEFICEPFKIVLKPGAKSTSNSTISSSFSLKEEKLDPLSIAVQIQEQTEKTVIINISNGSNMQYYCYFTLKQGIEEEEDYSTNKLSIPGKSTINHSLDFPEDVTDYDNGVYEINNKCYVNNIESNFTQQTLFEHINTSQLCPLGELTEKDICRDIKIHTLPKLDEPLDRTPQTEKINILKQGGYYAFIFYYKALWDQISKSSGRLLNTLRLYSEGAELIVNWKVSKDQFSIVKNLKNQGIFKEILMTIWTTEVPGTLNEAEVKVYYKYLNLIMFYLTDACDAYDQKANIYVKMVLELFTKSLSNEHLLNLPIYENTKDDFFLASSFLVNIKQLFSYLQLYGLVNEYDTKTGFINEEHIVTIHKELKNYGFNLVKRNYSLKYENMQFFVKPITGDDNSTKITFSDFNGVIDVPLTSIREKIKSKILGLGVIIFNENPFISYKVTSLQKQSLSLHVFTEDGEVEIDNLNTEHKGNGDHFLVKFKVNSLNMENAGKPYCYQYDENTGDITYEGIVTEYVKDDDNVVKCYSSKTGEILIGYLEEHSTTREVNKDEWDDDDDGNSGILKYVLIIAIAIVIILLIGLLVYIFIIQKKLKDEKVNVVDVGVISFCDEYKEHQDK